MLKLGEHTYTLATTRSSAPRSGKMRWVCGKTRWHKCKACVYTIDNTIISFNNNYNHDSANLRGIPANYIVSKYGNNLIVMGSNRYYLHGTYKKRESKKKRWMCIKNRGGCRVVLFTMNDIIVETKYVHNHS
ncbi:FLYWCH zinc finger domain-containing protein [Phthorimaea operculella]|nr:FLYWCH zinc finger domain-containing protein [Phthorimaea operculella]